MPSKRIIILSVVSILSVLLAWNLASRTGADFEVFLQAAQKMNAHENIYAPPFVRNLLYYYSPFFAFLLKPFADNWVLSKMIWLVLSFVMAVRSYFIIRSFLKDSGLSCRQMKILGFGGIVFAAALLNSEFRMVQMTVYLLWTMLESIRLLREEKQFAAGVLLGMAINIKIMPVLLLPWLFWRGYFKALAACVLTFVALLFLPGFFIGFDYNNELLHQWWLMINPTNTGHLFETEVGPHSLTALLPVYLRDLPGVFPLRRHIVDLPPQTVELIINLSRLFLLGLSLFYLRTKPFVRQPDKWKLYWEVCYFLMLIPLLMPHQQKYNWLLVVPMMVWLLFYFLRSGKTSRQIFALILFCIAAFFFTPLYGSDLLGKYFRISQHYRVLTMVTLLLIPLSLYCSPGRLLRNQAIK